jgi:hypothetical protein
MKGFGAFLVLSMAIIFLGMGFLYLLNFLATFKPI